MKETLPLINLLGNENYLMVFKGLFPLRFILGRLEN